MFGQSFGQTARLQRSASDQAVCDTFNGCVERLPTLLAAPCLTFRFRYAERNVSGELRYALSGLLAQHAKEASITKYGTVSW